MHRLDLARDAFDGRRMQTERLVTYKDMIEEVGLKDIEIVPRADSVEVEIQLMRQDFSTYRFDETHCKAGIEHLDGFAKVFNKTMQVFTSAIAKNGHQHAADALRQKASAGKHGMLNTNTVAKDLKRSRKRRGSAMTA